MSPRFRILSLTAACLLSTAPRIYADKGSQTSDALKSAPPAVQLAVIQLAGGNKINEFESETENGKTVYDVEFAVKGNTYEADIDSTGQILTREVEVDLAIVPPAVLDAAKKAHDGASIGEATIVTSGDKMFYELDVKSGKDTCEMQLTAAGGILADTIEAPEPGEKEDKD